MTTATDSETETSANIEPLRRLSRDVARRIRFARGSRALATIGAVGVVSVAVAVTVDRLVGLPGNALGMLVATGLGIPLATAIASAARRIPELLPASLIDRSHALSGRVSIALELAATTSADALSRLAIADAVGRAGSIAPARAFPIRAPRHLRALALAIVALGIALAIERPHVVTPVATAAAPRLEALLVHPDDLEARRDAVERIEAGPNPTEELRQAIAETNELLEALSDRTLDRTEAMRRIAALEEALARPRPPELVAREEALEAMGDRLGRGELTSALAEALRESDAAGAAEEMRSLADRARAGDLSAAERRALREALEELAAMHETEEQQAELRDAEDALARETERGEERESLLEQRQEEVERLRQEHEERMAAERELERLERELDEAREELSDGESDQEAAESMDDAAEELNRTAREQLSEQEMQQLRQQLQQLREMIRRQRREGGQDENGGEGEGEGSAGGGSRSGQSQMDRFVLRARGGSEGSEGMSIGTPSGSGGGGEGESEGGTGEGGEEQEGTPGGASGSSPGSEGQGGTGEETGEQMLVVGEGGSATLELPGFGQGHGAPSGGGDGDDGPGDGAGSGHEDGATDDPTDRGGDHRTVAVHGDDQGRGPSRSEVIRGGAARGFASRDYERVYADYAQHAEEEIEADEIPPGYRFYVRRYFELIRPR